MKKNSIISLSAVALLAASAQAKDLDHSAYLPADDAGRSYVTVTGGSMLDIEEPYIVANFGYQIDEISSFSLQAFYLKDSFYKVEYAHFEDFYEEQYLGLGAGYRASFSVTERASLYLGASAGIVFISSDLNWKDYDTYINTKGDGTSFYADAVAGIEYKLTDHLSLNAAARFIYINDYNVKYRDSEYEFKIEHYTAGDLFGLEAGLTYRF